MIGADFGVNLAFWLTICSTFICVWYGVVNWNRGSNEVMSKDIKKWAKTEDKIDEAL